MRILMVITGMQSGGAERVMATLCNYLSMNHEVCLAIMKEAESDYKLSEKVEIAAGNIKGKSLLDSVKFTKRVAEDWKPDVILSFMTKSNIIALLARGMAKHKCPVIIAERANPYYAGKIFKAIRRFLYPRADGCVFQTLQAQKYYTDRKMLRCESAVLKNPLNPDFKVVPFEGERRKKIVTAGRLSPEKNQESLIRAFADIAADYPEYVVEIYGDGPLLEKLQMVISEVRMENRVFLMGRRKDIQACIRDASIFVLPSISEGMPNALLEAMALGIPCIATDCPIGGSAVIVQNEENGILIPMEDQAALRDALVRMLEHPELADRMSKAARNVTNEFETSKVCAAWERYLTQVQSAKEQK